MEERLSKVPKTLNAKPIAFLFLITVYLWALLMPLVPKLWSEVQKRANQAQRAGWELDWYSGTGCLADTKCYAYLFQPLKGTPLEFLIPLGYDNLLLAIATIALLPVLLAMAFFLIRKVQESFRNYEGHLLGTATLLASLGVAVSYSIPHAPLLNTLSLPLGVFLALFLSRFFPGARILAPYNARYATDIEVKDMLETRPGPYSILLAEKREGKGVYVVKPGTSGRKELEHVLIVAPTRSGKGLHLQTLAYTWGGSMVIVDIKGEMHRRTSGHRSAIGPVYLIDPTGDGHRYDPFAELQTDEELNSAVRLILETGDPENKIFEDRAAYAFLAMVAAAKVRAPDGSPFKPEWTSTLRAVLDLLEMGSRGVKELLTGGRGGAFFADAIRRGDRWAMKASFNIKQFYGDGSDEKFRESSWSILASTLQALSTEGVRKMMSGSDFRASDLVERPSTLYLRFPESELKATLPVLKLVEISLFSGALRYIDQTLLGWSPNPILWAFDEAGAAPVPELPKHVSTWAGRNMYALIYIQDLSQLEDAYESAGAETILSNTLQIFYVGNPNIKTCEYVSQALGKLSQESASYTFSKDSSESRSFVARELIAPDEFRQASYPGAHPNDVFVFPRGRRPIWARKIRPNGQIKVPELPPVYPWRKESEEEEDMEEVVEWKAANEGAVDEGEERTSHPFPRG